MSKRKSFRRVKVWSCVPGKRLRMFSRPAPKSQTSGILNEEAPASATNTDEGKVEKVLSVSTSYDNTNMKEDAR